MPYFQHIYRCPRCYIKLTYRPSKDVPCAACGYAPAEEAVIEVKKWRYIKPPWIPEGATEYVHPCGCKEVLKDGVWYAEQCSRHKAERDALIERLKERI